MNVKFFGVFLNFSLLSFNFLRTFKIQTMTMYQISPSLPLTPLFFGTPPRLCRIRGGGTPILEGGKEIPRE